MEEVDLDVGTTSAYLIKRKDAIEILIRSARCPVVGVRSSLDKILIVENYIYLSNITGYFIIY